MAKTITLLLLVLLVAGCGKAPPNIVLIYIDDLGWRDVGFMGSTYYNTPHIDRLAQEGTVFTNAYANAPNCAPSRASLLSGLYTPRHGVLTVGNPARGKASLRRLIPAENRTTLDTSFVTLAEALQTAGYATAHIGKWHLGDGVFAPEHQGFDRNIAGNARGHPPSYFHPYQNRRDTLHSLAETGRPGEYLTDRLTDEALAFIEAHAARPFFLYLAHYAVHTPLQAPEADVDRYRDKPATDGHNNPTYAAMIDRVDAGVGRVLDALDRLGLTDDTLVLFYSDNGGYGPATSMAPLRGSKGMLYEGGIRVPFAVRRPNHVRAGHTEDTPVIGTDLYPTLLDIAGIQPPTPVDGVSLLPVLTGKGSLPSRALFWHFPAYLEAYRGMDSPWRTTPAGALRRGDYKLIEFFEDSTLELYHLTDDPGETRNLGTTLPDTTAALYNALQRWRQSVSAPMPQRIPPPLYPDAE